MCCRRLLALQTGCCAHDQGRRPESRLTADVLLVLLSRRFIVIDMNLQVVTRARFRKIGRLTQADPCLQPGDAKIEKMGAGFKLLLRFLSSVPRGDVAKRLCGAAA